VNNHSGFGQQKNPTAAQIIEALTLHGYRSTSPRLTVVESVLRYDRPFTAEQLVAAVRNVDASLGRATVYRTLEILASIDVVTRILQPGGHPAYVVGSPGHRHHLVCSGCGSTVAFTACPVDDLVNDLRRNTDYAISGHLLEVFGVCPSCQRPDSPAHQPA